MTQLPESVHLLQYLIDPAVCLGTANATVRAIQRDLANAIQSGQIRLGAKFCLTKPGSYALVCCYVTRP